MGLERAKHLHLWIHMLRKYIGQEHQYWKINHLEVTWVNWIVWADSWWGLNHSSSPIDLIKRVQDLNTGIIPKQFKHKLLNQSFQMIQTKYAKFAQIDSPSGYVGHLNFIHINFIPNELLSWGRVHVQIPRTLVWTISAQSQDQHTWKTQLIGHTEICVIVT